MKDITITVSGEDKAGTTTVMRLIAERLRQCSIEVEERHSDSYPQTVIDGVFSPMKILPNYDAVEEVSKDTRIVLVEEKD